ncbi:MAG: DUF433 domain-containing protein [Planctomycetaceae bacterium]|nr:DUF433 domain-containing protein [Planctomycetaceae bacterium]
MSAKTEYPHLTIEPDRTIRIGQTRYKVLHLAAEHYQHGWTAEELLRQHPDLRPEEVYAALTYFYDHRDELISELKETLKEAESLRTTQPLTRDELLTRRADAGR